MRTARCFVALTVLLLPRPLSGAVLTVGQDGTALFSSIQEAITASQSGDTVRVSAGRFVENIDFGGKNVVVMGSGWNVTTIDGSQGDAPTVTFSSGESREAVLTGFTITGGSGGGNSPERMGGGVFIDTAEPSIINNRISSNAVTSTTAYGGGLLAISRGATTEIAPLIEDNIIAGNTAMSNGGGIGLLGFVRAEIRRNRISGNATVRGDGAGVWLRSGTTNAVIEENVIVDNIADDHGGGVYCSGLSGSTLISVRISRNVIVNNTSHGSAQIDFSGGGVWCGNTHVIIDHNTFVGNRGFGFGGGIAIVDKGSANIANNLVVKSFGGGIVCGGEASISLTGNIAWENDYEGRERCTDWAERNGNLIADPQFCDLDSGNYTVHAFSPALTSMHAPIGAFPQPGCFRAIIFSTWGALKARFAE